eukprot:12221242-Alexandrium_andersonii.AAC.1
MAGSLVPAELDRLTAVVLGFLLGRHSGGHCKRLLKAPLDVVDAGAGRMGALVCLGFVALPTEQRTLSLLCEFRDRGDIAAEREPVAARASQAYRTRSRPP